MPRFSMALTGACLVLGLLCGPAAANDSDGGGGNDGGGGGRDSVETFIREYIDLRLPTRGEKVVEVFVTKLGQRRQEAGTDAGQPSLPGAKQVMIDARIIEVTDVNKLDLSGVPLFGSFVGPEFNGDDMTEENKVGNVYSTGNGGLYVVLQPTALGNPGQLNLSRLIVFNDDYSQEVKPLKVNLDPSQAETEQSLGSLAGLPSVRSVTTDVAVPDGGTVLLGGLTQEEHRNDESQVPYLSDIPLLGSLFRGTAHQEGRSTLLILIKPSVLVRDD